MEKGKSGIEMRGREREESQGIHVLDVVSKKKKIVSSLSTFILCKGGRREQEREDKERQR